jgi:hypothetical protein
MKSAILNILVPGWEYQVPQTIELQLASEVFMALGILVVLFVAGMFLASKAEAVPTETPPPQD